MPTPHQIRTRLRTLLGEDRYEKFARMTPGEVEGTRLLYWMEETWEKFVAANPDCQLTYPEIVAIFSACPDHGVLVQRARQMELIASWLHGPLQPIEEVDADKLPFDPQRLRGKSQLQPGDAWQEFRSPRETWANMAGRAGIALVRDGKVIDFLVTRMN